MSSSDEKEALSSCSRAYTKAALWFNRAAFAVVFAINVTCAISFALFPQEFYLAYELDGEPGIVAVRGMGVAFLMWNATYPLFIYRPERYVSLGVVIIVQQMIGVIGESAILFSLGTGHELLASSILRFAIFDIAGAVIEIAAISTMLASRKLNFEERMSDGGGAPKSPPSQKIAK